MPNINIHDLHPGDVIVFVNRYYKAGANVSTPIAERYEDADYEDHIAMFSHFDEDHNPVVVHAINGQEGYGSTKPSGIVHSTLRRLYNQTDKFEYDGQEVIRRYDVDFIVFRYIGAQSELALRALTYFNIWNDFDIPYDEKRLKAKLDLEDEHGYTGKEFYELAQKNYATAGRFRAMKYAVRRNQSLTQGSIKKDGKGRGLTCSMALITAFQVAELEKHVATLSEVHSKLEEGAIKVYNSDKHAVFNPDYLPPVYTTYLESIGNRNTLVRSYYVTSLQFCRPGFNIFTFTHETFPVDSKCIGVAGITYLFQATPEVWQAVGTLQLDESIRFTEEQKQRYREQRALIQEYKHRRRLGFQMEGHYGSDLPPRTAEFVESLRTKRLPHGVKSCQSTPQRGPEPRDLKAPATGGTVRTVRFSRISGEPPKLADLDAESTETVAPGVEAAQSPTATCARTLLFS